MSMRISATDSETRRLGPALASALVGVLLAGGCLFTPRPALPPCDPRTDPDCRVIVPPQTPLNPRAVLSNIKSGLEQKVVDPHVKDSLDESFKYVPDEAARVQFGDYFDNPPWDKAREVRFMQKILESATRADSVTFFVPPTDAAFHDQGAVNNDTNTRRFLVDYKWTLVFHDSTQTSGKRRDVYHSTANWDFIGINTNPVKLMKWEDLSPANPADHSSGFLRGGSNVR